MYTCLFLIETESGDVKHVGNYRVMTFDVIDLTGVYDVTINLLPVTLHEM